MSSNDSSYGEGTGGKKEMKRVSREDLLRWGALAAILALFLALRLRNLGHILPWDESQLALTIKSYSAGRSDVWSSLAYLHPPIFLLISSVLTKILGFHAWVLELVSVSFSVGTFFITYLLAKDLFGDRIALLAVLFLAAAPALIVMDTWIKQDPTTGFFIVLTIFLFSKGKYIWSGVALGVGMLSKETAIFAGITLFLYAIFCWEREKTKGLLVTGGIGFLLSFWWYLFVSTGVGHFWHFFTGGSAEVAMFKKPFWAYFKALPTDAGWVVVVLMALGIIYSLYRLIVCRESEYSLPLVWFLSLYLFLSISAGKPYWMTTPALPAVAILASLGLIKTSGLIGRYVDSKRAASFAISIIIVIAAGFCVFQGITVDYAAYNRDKYWQYWDLAARVRQEASFLKQRVTKGPVVLLFDEEEINRNSVLSYYLGDVKTLYLESEALKSPAALIEHARKVGASWLYISKLGDKEYFEQITDFLRELEQLVPYGLKQERYGIIIKLR